MSINTYISNDTDKIDCIKCNQCSNNAINLDSWIKSEAALGYFDVIYELARSVIDIVVDVHESTDKMIHHLYICEYKHINATFINNPKDDDYVYVGADNYTNNLYYHVQGVFRKYNIHRFLFIEALKDSNIEHKFFDKDNIRIILNVLHIHHVTDKTVLYALVNCIPATNEYYLNNM